MFFRYLVLIHVCTAFPLQCPKPAQWSIRARGLCPDPSNYSCLKNDLINGFSENCTISDFQAPGRKGVLRGGLDADICSQERYHPWPIKYYTNASTNCIFLKSICNGEGQVVYGYGDRNTDSTCRCDYTRSYNFIGKPRNPCFCVPSEEDCSCYLKTCIGKNYFLSPDYECIHEKMNTPTANNCTAINKERVSTERSDSSTEYTTRTENIQTIVQRKSYARIIVIAFSIGTLLLYCIHELWETCYINGLGVDMTDMPLNGCFDKEAQKSQIVESEKDIDEIEIEVGRRKTDRSNVPDIDEIEIEVGRRKTVRSNVPDIDEIEIEVGRRKTVRSNVPDWMNEIFQNWEKEEGYFIKTRASKYVMDCIIKHPCVSVIGPSGVGKTFLVQHVALEMNKIGYRIMKVNSPIEIEANYISDRKTLFVVDDMCGNFTASKSKLNDWKIMIDNINVLLKTDSCKLILTCRLQVFRDEGFEHSNFQVFKNCICNLDDDKLCLTKFEKQELAKQYFKGTTINIEHLFQYDFFPFLCQYYDRNKHKSNFCLKTFLRDPFAPFGTNINDLFVEGQGSRYKFCALLLLVLCNNQIESKSLEGKKDKYKIILKDIQEKCRIDKQLTGELLISELHTLTGTFLKNQEGIFQTIHDKLFDFLTHYFGTKNTVTKTEFIELLIRHADDELIKERFVITKPGQSDDTKRKEYVITIEKREDDDKLQLYTARVFHDMTKDDRYLWSNRNLYNKTFLKTLSTIIKKLDKDKILHFIKTASSLFVCDMFAMDVNDLKSIENFPCGIILDQEHLEKFVERIFNDIKKSDDIRHYISILRCSSNEEFCTALQRFMNDHPFIRIEELKRVSISFIQIMCVLTEKDIKHNSPYVYKRYGFKIPCDLRKQYIQRVFDDISMSLDVNKYIEYNRNRTNPIFKTRLLGHMRQLCGSKIDIKHLIDMASQDFIDRLCVMTIDSIKDNFDFEYERYGVVIPEDCTNLYISRVFDGLKKSDDTESYVKHNRNIQTKKFKTSLRTYIEKLPEHEIKNLIKTASSNFLNKWFVATREDIQIDSIREYEQYGIILQGKNFSIYCERIFTLLARHVDFMNDIKFNRNTRRVLEYITQLHISQITELIQTTSVESFHKITVDVQNGLEEEYLSCQSEDYIARTIMSMKGVFITWPESHIDQYMDRMVSDWRNGYLYAVIENVNMKNKYFVEKFLDYLNHLEPSTISELVNGINQEAHKTYALSGFDSKNAITICCIHCDVNLAKWCLESHCYGNRYEKHYKLCALFILVVFNNDLNEQALIDDEPTVRDMIMSFGRNHDIDHAHEDISASLLCEALDSTLQGIVVKIKGVWHVINNELFDYLYIYFGSIKDVSNILIKYGDVQFLFKTFMVGKSDWGLVYLPDRELQSCIERVFESMFKSIKNIRYIIDISHSLHTSINAFSCLTDMINQSIVNAFITYIRNLKKDEIEILIKSSCIEFLNNFMLIVTEETNDDVDMFRPVIELPDVSVKMYVKSIFDHVTKSECVEICLNENLNKQNKTFHTSLSTYMREINREDVEKLMRKASSDFISRMFVISEEDIKVESFWECERYGIVVPENLIPKYIERVFGHITNSINVPENRNIMNKKFRDTFHSYIRSISEDKLTSLIKTASSKFISHMFLSTEDDFSNISSQRRENYFMFVPQKFLHIFEQICLKQNVANTRMGTLLIQ